MIRFRRKRPKPSLTSPGQPGPDCLRAGDVLVCDGRGWMSWLIGLFTFGPTHVAVVADFRSDLAGEVWGKSGRYGGDRRLVFESTTLANQPCALLGKAIAGAQAHELSDLLGYPGKIWRLPIMDPLTRWESRLLTVCLLRDLGRPYDYDGAFTCATRWWKRLWGWWPTWDRSRLYCVEYAGSALWLALRQHLDKRWNAGELTPREFVEVLLASGLYGEPERIK